MKNAFAIALVAWWVIGAADAAVITVGSTGCDHTDLQTAIDDAQPDDELRLRLETFGNTNVNIDKDLVIIGGYVDCDDMVPDVGNPTILQGGSGAGDSVIEVLGTFNSVQLTNLFITGGESDMDFGGGIEVGVASNINMSFVTVDGNDSQRGGGIFLDANATLRRNGPVVISGNTADYGGGVYVTDLANIDFADGSSQPLTITDNVASGAGLGGGIYLDEGADMFVDDAGEITIQNNQAISGGGIYVGPDITMDAERLSVNDNIALSGGGMYVEGQGGAIPGSPDIVLGGDVEVTGNSALAGGGIYLDDGGGYWLELSGEVRFNEASTDGGGLYMDGDGRLELIGLINGNTADQDGGGIYAAAGEIRGAGMTVSGNDAANGGGIHATGVDFDVADANSVISNEAANSGGGIYLAFSNLESTSVSLFRFGLDVLANTAGTGDGGGLFIDSSDISLNALAVTDNAAQSGAGGGIYHVGSGDLELVNALVRDNAADTGGGIHYGAGGRVTLSADMVIDGIQPMGASVQCDPSELLPDNYCSQVSGNTAATAGGVYITTSTAGPEPHRILQTAFMNNTGDLGSALSLVDAQDVWVRTSLFSGHESSGGSGVAAIRTAASTGVLIDSTTVVDNDVAGIVLGGSTAFLNVFNNNLLWGNDGDFGAVPGSDVSVACNLSQDGTLPGVSGMPAFIETARGKYRLSDLSDAVDQCGMAGTDTDLDGVSRPLGALHDVGALEGAWGIPETLFADGFE